MISVGIIGGTGYTGKHLLSFCEKHSQISEYQVYGKSSAGNSLDSIFPELEGMVSNQIVKSVDELSFNHDAYLLALPHGESLNFVPQLFNSGKVVIDLGGDFRLDNVNDYDKWYGYSHPYSELLNEKVYGLSDYDSANILNHKLIANPGCYPTSVLLGLLPIVKEFSNNIISASTVSYSGTSGAGKSAKKELLLSEMDGNVKAYNINKHRHQPEIEQRLKKEGLNSPYSFTTHLLPTAVGIYSTTSVHFNITISQDMIDNIYQEKYGNSTFVRLRNSAPELKWVVGSNFCDINANALGSTLIITSTIDNLIKGASGQAIQNLNLAFGWEHSESLLPNNHTLLSSVGGTF